MYRRNQNNCDICTPQTDDLDRWSLYFENILKYIKDIIYIHISYYIYHNIYINHNIYIVQWFPSMDPDSSSGAWSEWIQNSASFWGVAILHMNQGLPSSQKYSSYKFEYVYMYMCIYIYKKQVLHNYILYIFYIISI